MQKFVAAWAQGKFDYVYQINIHLEINDSCNHQQNPKACWALGKDHCSGREGRKGQGVCEGRLERSQRVDEEDISGSVAFPWCSGGQTPSLILLINWGTELNHSDGIGIWLKAAERHCGMESTHRYATQGCCQWKENARTLCSSLGKQSMCNSRKSCLRWTVQPVWLSATIILSTPTYLPVSHGKGHSLFMLPHEWLACCTQTRTCVYIMLQVHSFLLVIFKDRNSSQSFTHIAHSKRMSVQCVSLAISAFPSFYFLLNKLQRKIKIYLLLCIIFLPPVSPHSILAAEIKIWKYNKTKKSSIWTMWPFLSFFFNHGTLKGLLSY